MTKLVFFGAGASRPFNIPTMQEMVDEFESNLEDFELSTLYHQIKSTLLTGYEKSQVDIESIFSVIQGISSKIEPMKLGHFVFYYLTKVGNSLQLSDKDIQSATKITQRFYQIKMSSSITRFPTK